MFYKYIKILIKIFITNGQNVEVKNNEVNYFNLLRIYICQMKLYEDNWIWRLTVMSKCSSILNNIINK